MKKRLRSLKKKLGRWSKKMEVDLNDTEPDNNKFSRFEDESINFDKSVNFVFGKNGTGKSSICDLIRTQNSNGEHGYDAYIFQGFESVISDDQKLNAIILGEENTKIDKIIKEYESEITDIQGKIDAERAKIVEPQDKSENLYTQKLKLEKKKQRKENKEQKFYSNSASEIANIKDPVVVENVKNYNKNSFQGEIEDALKSPILSNEEIVTLKETITSTQKPEVEKIYLNEIDFAVLQEDIENLLLKTVQPSIKITELDNDNNKRQFAEIGKDCHSAGDTCAFCGNIVTNERLQKLEKYFSGSEIDKFTKELSDKLIEIKNYENKLEKIIIQEEAFYPEFKNLISEIVLKIDKNKLKQQKFLEKLKGSLEGKQKNLFDTIPYKSEALPSKLSREIKEYNKLVKENNEYTKDLKDNKTKARTKLRYNAIAEIVRNSNIEEIKTGLSNAISDLDDKEEEIQVVKDTIEDYEKEKGEKQKEINKQLSKTKNTGILAKNINKKLENYTNFTLERKDDQGREFYEIKEKIEGEEKTRSVVELSTGEKNIVALLYFIESLNDSENNSNKPKFIVFDDPMNSNDDTMQYLIANEILKLVKQVNKPKNKDKILILTHNVLFYLNITRDIKNEYRLKKKGDGNSINPYKEINFYRLMSYNGKTKIQKLQKDSEDFKTQYESLWFELIFLHEMDKPELMCNPARRIIESYISFTKKENFYKDNKDAKNLFNANSHNGILDPTTDILGKTSEDIKNILHKCFEENHGEDHFKRYWRTGKG